MKRLIIFSYLLSSVLQLFANRIDKSGEISTREEWSDTICITGDISIVQNGELIILPGTYIEFQDQYKISLKENAIIQAIGNVSDSIIFTALDPNDGWFGFRMDSIWQTADSSIFDYCKIMYAKTTNFTNGGAIEIKKFNKIRISNCQFSYNKTNTRYGGVLYADSSNIKIIACEFSNNYSGSGGAIYIINSSPTIKNSNFTSNEAYWWGSAIYIKSCNINISNCNFYNNFIPSTRGEVIFIEKSDGIISNVNITNNENKAFRLYHSEVSLINALIANNGNEIGAIEILACNPKIINSTIVNNFGYNVGGIDCWYAKPEIINSIVWNNHGGEKELTFEGDGYFPKIINSNVKDGFNLNIPDSLYINNISKNPKFNNPNPNVGFNNDYKEANWQLLACSPCINKGDNDLIPDTINYDLFGLPRIFEDTIDIGAFELQDSKLPLLGRKTIYVKAESSGSGDSWNDALGSLQEAIDYPVVCYEGIDIWLAEGNYYPDTTNIIDKRTSTFKLRDNVTIYGGFIGNETLLEQRNFNINKSILNGNWGQTDAHEDNSYSVVTANFTDSTSVLDGIAVVEGNSAGSGFAHENGAGIYLHHSDMMIKNTTIQDNYAGSSGGGIYLDYSNLQIINTNIYNNQASSYGGGAYFTNSHPKIVSSKIINNAVLYSFDGGGFYLQNSNPAIINSIISNNESSKYGGGGGIYCSYSSPIILNSLLANNKSGRYGRGGGAIYCSLSSYPVTTNTIFWQNYDYEGIEHFSAHSDIEIKVINSNVQGGNKYGISTNNYVNNIDTLPRFISPSLSVGISDDALSANWNINPCSPYIDKGTIDDLSVSIPSKDILGNTRILGSSIDIGPFEFDGVVAGLEPKLIIYVKPGETGSGQSWDDPIGDIQKAIDIPLGCHMKKEIWVAQGTYYPDTTGLEDSRSASFILRNNNEVYGGFNGTELNISERSIVENATILSGDIGILENDEDNSYNVIKCFNLNPSSILDGLFVEGGYASEYLDNGNGGGVLCINSNNTFRNLTIQNNFSNYDGAGISCFNSGLQLSNSLIKDNYADGNGGAVSIKKSIPVLLNNKIVNNYANGNGGAIYSYESFVHTINCIIANNEGYTGGGYFSAYSNSKLINSTITNNRGHFNHTGGIEVRDTLLIQNCIIWGNTNNVEKNQIGINYNYDLIVKNSDIEEGNTFGLIEEKYIDNIDSIPGFVKPIKDVGISDKATLSDWNIGKCSPCINKGLNEGVLEIVEQDINNNPRVFNSIADIGANEIQDLRRQAPEDILLTNNKIKELLPENTFIGKFYMGNENENIEYYFSDNDYIYNYDTTYFSIRADSLFSDEIFNYNYQRDFSFFAKALNEYGCSMEKEIFIEVLDSITTTGFEENTENEFQITIYPNPARNYLMVKSKSEITLDAEIRIYSLEGKLVKIITPNTKQTYINVSHLNKGSYNLIILKNGIKKVAKTFVKE